MADNVKVWKGSRRGDIFKLLNDADNIGIELGVANGQMSSFAINSGKFKRFIGIDMYLGIHPIRGTPHRHNIKEYKHNLRGGYNPLTSNNIILRMTFEEAVDLFPDNSFDFIYVDGYAHTGEEEGKTYHQWWPKLKPGGMFAGDDYDPKWPKVIKHVDAFVAKHNLDFTITELRETSGQGKFPTWYTFKPKK